MVLTVLTTRNRGTVLETGNRIADYGSVKGHAGNLFLRHFEISVSIF